jgi:hypothetical protein
VLNLEETNVASRSEFWRDFTGIYESLPTVWKVKNEE